MQKSNRTARAALVISVIALVMACVGGAYAVKFGKNSVKTKFIKNKAVTTAKLADNAVTTEKIASLAAIPGYVHFNSGGTLVGSKGVNAVNKPVPNVACLDLTFVPTTGIGSRGVGAGGPPINSAQVAVGADAVALGCTAPFNDAVVQVAAAAQVQDLTAWFQK